MTVNADPSIVRDPQRPQPCEGCPAAYLFLIGVAARQL